VPPPKRDIGDRLTGRSGNEARGVPLRVQRARLVIDRITGNAAGALELNVGDPLLFRITQSVELAKVRDGVYELAISINEFSVRIGTRVVFRGAGLKWVDPRAAEIFAAGTIRTELVVGTMAAASDEKSYPFTPNLRAFEETPDLKPLFAGLVARYSTWPRALNPAKFAVADLEAQMAQSGDLRGMANLFTQMWTEYRAAGGRRIEDFSLLSRQALAQWSYENLTFRANRLQVANGYDGPGLYRRDGYPFAIYDAGGLPKMGIGGAPRDPYYTTERPKDAIRIRLPEGRATEILGIIQQLLIDQPLEEVHIIAALIEHHELLVREVTRDWDYAVALRKEMEALIPNLIIFWIAEAAGDFLILRGTSPLAKGIGVQIKAITTAAGLLFNFAYFGECAVALVRVGYYLMQVRLDEKGEPASPADRYALHEAAVNLRVLLVAYAVLLGTHAAGKVVGKVKSLFFNFPFGPGAGPTAFATNESFIYRVPRTPGPRSKPPVSTSAMATRPGLPGSQETGGGASDREADTQQGSEQSEKERSAKEQPSEESASERETEQPDESAAREQEESVSGEQEGSASDREGDESAAKRKTKNEERDQADNESGRDLEARQRRELDEIPRQANEARSRPNQTLRTWLRAVIERYIAERQEDKDFTEGQANAMRQRVDDVLAQGTYAFLREIGLADTYIEMVTYYQNLVQAYERGIEFHEQSLRITGSEPVELKDFEARRDLAQQTLDALIDFAIDAPDAAQAEGTPAQGLGSTANPRPTRTVGTIGNKKLDIAQAFFGAKPKMAHTDSTQAIGWDFHTLKSIVYREAMSRALPAEWNVTGYESNGPRTIEVPTIDQFRQTVDGMMNGTTPSELERMLDRFSPEEEGE
jgi:hypothetical protein